MKKLFLVSLTFFVFVTTIVAQSVTATYTVADIPTGDGTYDATCNGPLTTLVVNVPAGADVTSVDVAYNMTSSGAGGGWMAEQKSQLFCQETGLDEGGYSSGTGSSSGTFSYNRTNLTLANGITASGVLTFEMRAYRTWSGTAGCNTTVSKVDNNTWTITVNYIIPSPMVYTSSTVTQNNLSDASICGVDQEIIGVAVEMTGGLNLLDITEFQIDMTGTTNIADVSNIDIFYTGTSSTFVATNLFASASPAGGTIIINGTQTLSPGINYFWIAYDIAPGATLTNVLDAQCTQLTIDGTNRIPSPTTVAGSRALNTCTPTPGGVAETPLIWLQANSGTTPTSGTGNLTSWSNIGTGGSVTIMGPPTYNSTGHNFNPTVHFNGDTNYLSLTGINFTSLFVVAELEDLSRVNTHINTWDQVTYGVHTDKNLHGGINGGLAAISQIGYAPEFDGAAVWGFDGISVGANDQYRGTHDIISAVGTEDVFTNRLLGGQVDNIPGGFNGRVRDWKGDVSEYILFSGAVSAIERHKIESYLAIKYGKTLGVNGISMNYNSTDNTVVWDQSANNAYAYDITGIGRADATGLDQRKSQTENKVAGNPRDMLTAANGTNFTTPTAFTLDQEYFVWGHNDGAKSLTGVTTFTTINGDDINAVLDRHWKGQETGVVETITLHFDMSTVSGITNWSGLKLLVDDDGTFTTGAYSVSPSLIDSTGSMVVEFEHDFSATEGFYFTLGSSTFSQAPEIDNPVPITVCYGYELPTITGVNLNNPNYYSDINGPNGTGTIIPVGTIITTDTTIYLYDEQGLAFDEDTLTIFIASGNSINLGNDTTICTNEQVTLDAGAGYDYYLWNDNSTNQTLVVNSADTFWVKGISGGTNLVINGDFEAGNTGFTTNYIVGPGGTWGPVSSPGTYLVTSDPNIAHTNFPSCVDHTSGTGNMMVINGADIANQNVWCETISVTPNTDYEFSTWVQNYYSSDPAMLSFFINGVQLGNTFSPTSSGCPWQNFFELWNSGVATSAQICIVNESTAGAGNDFALDDISFSPVCISYDTIIVDQNPLPTVNLNNVTICEGDTAVLDAGNAGATYLWQDNTTTTQTFNATSAGTYSVDVTENGCSATGTAVVTVNSLPIVDAGNPQTICEGEDVVLSGSGATSYTWDNGVSDGIVFNPTNTLLYTVTGNTNGCTATDTVTVFVNPGITVDAGNPQIICEGEDVVLSGSGATSYTWNNGVNDGVVFNPTNTLLYTVTGNTNGCTATDTVTVFVNPLPVVNAGLSQTICEGEDVTLTAIGAVNYDWDVNGVVNGVPFSPTSTTVYTVIGTDNNQCENSDVVTVTVNPTFSSSIHLEMMNGDSVLIAGSYEYQAGTYYELLQSVDGCDSTIIYTIDILLEDSIFIPNVFTPNGDNSNDLFLPILVNVKEFECTIFNRWGNKIYYWNELNAGWDGRTNSGNKVPEGTYFYIMNIIDSKDKNQLIKGTVTLLR
ncbi:MAG: gliding motility-associated C-terminal domain-containing protein [Flavobacteriales bacterium]|nr:gliding motility-associated C-terminal domain-containing protein [Flavobacteriales bacterium]MCB9364557.1 gliding motility-associated C-terminal domain-containing protein [Flavobacteriales bacterium]